MILGSVISRGVKEVVNANAGFPVSEWTGKRVRVLGLGRSGESATQLLIALGAKVVIVEENITGALEPIKTRLSQQGVRIVERDSGDNGVDLSDLLVVSPGIPKDHQIIKRAQERGIAVIGEIELASWFLKVPIIAVTGTNGKSTTVRLIGSILQQSRRQVFVGGNLGVPLCEAVLRPGRVSIGPGYEFVVAEVSSFQLETIHRFRPWISVLLNVTPDHLDRHPTPEDYISAKVRIFENQTFEDAAFVNWDDPLVRSMAAKASSRVYGFSLTGEVDRGVYLAGQTIWARMDETAIPVLHREEIPLRGDHNVANAMAAIGVGLLCHCSLESMRDALQKVPIFEHALEPVREWGGIRFINDSKGTNVDATLKAINSFQDPLILILGGKDKGGDFTLLASSIRRQVKRLVVIGEATPKIAKALGSVKPITVAGTLKEAVDQAIQAASAGDVVLFSPACASFDMFENYHHRGMEFKRIVGELPETR